MTLDELEQWGEERCGVYAWNGPLLWAGPYHDAAVLDRVALCWYTRLVTVGVIGWGTLSGAEPENG